MPVPVESRQIDGFRLIQRRLLHRLRLAVARDGHRVMALIRFQISALLILAQIGFQVQQTIRRIVLHGVVVRHPRLTARLDEDNPVVRLGKTVGYARFFHRIGIRGQINRGQFSVFDLHRVGAAVLPGQRKRRGKAGVCILRAVRRIEHLFEDKLAVLRVVILELGFHRVFFRSGRHRHKLIRIERLADFDRLLVARLDVGIARFHPRAHHIVVAFGQFPARLKRADPVGKLRVLAKHQLVLFVGRHFAGLINRKDRVAARIGRSVRYICRQLHILFRQDVAALTHEMIIQRFAAVGRLFIAVAVNLVVQLRIQRDAQALKVVIQPFVVAVQLKVRPVIDQVDRVIVVRIDRRMNGIIAVQRRRVVDRVSFLCGHYEAACAIPVFHNIAGVGAVSKCHCGLLRIDLRAILSRNRLNRFLERIAGKIEYAMIHVVAVLAQNLALRSQRARAHLIGEGYLVAVYRVPHGLVLHIPRLCFRRIPEGVRVDRCPIVNRRTGVNFLFAVFVIVVHLRRDRRGE